MYYYIILLYDEISVIIFFQSNIIARGSYRELQWNCLDLFKSLRSTDVTSITYDQGTRCKVEDESNSHSLCVLSRHQSQTTIDKNNESKGIVENPTDMAESQSSEHDVPDNVYSSYISAGGNACRIIFLLLVCILTELLGTGGDWWIGYWYVSTRDWNLNDFIGSGSLKKKKSFPVNTNCEVL